MKSLHENNKTEQNSKNTTKLKIVVFSLLFLVVLLGISYALFSEILIGEKDYSVTSRGLQIVLDESETSESISVGDAIPILDENGMKNEKFKFSLVNNEDEDIQYTIFMVENEHEKLTPSSAIRYYYKRDIGEIKVIRGMTEQQDENGKNYLEKGVIPANNTYNYEFCMWLSYEAGNEVMGTTYSIHLEVETAQTLAVYKDEVLNGADPVLTPNLIPVTIDTTGVVTKASAADEWYSYADREWANAVVLIDDSIEYNANDVIPESNIESYFVWIPRFKYQIFDEGSYTSLTGITNATQVINVEFETTDDPISSGTTLDSWLTHPAFTAFDSNGFWVGKFEPGGANTNTYNPDAIRIKPNQASWRNITVGIAFQNSYNYMRAEESHMMKNSEWGAVAYLQHSTYGSRQSLRVNNNSSYLTGYAAVSEPTCGYNNETSTSCNLVGTATSVTLPYNTTTGYLASTTGNISGVYDMSGGAWEYVMGYTTATSSVGGSSGMTSIFGDFFTSIDWEKYYDKYTVNSQTGFSNRILGDATGEMGSFANAADPDGTSRPRSSWYGDYGYFVTAANPWFVRGGGWLSGIVSGAFAFYCNTGEVNRYMSFRIVLTP